MKSNNPDIVLRCPECDGDVGVPETLLIPGRLIQCKHCGAEVYLSRYRDFPDEPSVWHLESELPDEPGLGNTR